MSYILDALNKSDQERSGHTPNLKTVHTPAITGHRFPRSWQWLLVFLVVIALIAGGRLLLFDQDSTDNRPLAIPRSPDTRQPIIQAPGTSSPDNSTGIEAAPPVAPPIEVATRKISNNPAGTELTNRSATDLLKARMSFSTHVYASESDWRRVSINGVSRKEGDDLGAGAVLAEITESGVILSYEGLLIPVDFVSDWTME